MQNQDNSNKQNRIAIIGIVATCLTGILTAIINKYPQLNNTPKTDNNPTVNIIINSDSIKPKVESEKTPDNIKVVRQKKEFTTIIGYVVDKNTNAPLSGVIVTYKDYESTTNDEGRFEMKIMKRSNINYKIALDFYKAGYTSSSKLTTLTPQIVKKSLQKNK